MARRAACTSTRTSTSTSTRTRNPAADGSDQLHNDHIPLVSNMKPRPASPTAAKPTARSRAPVNPPRTLPSGVAASPHIFFDPWNSSSTGHQRAENRLSGSTSWRQSRSLKLTEQYKGGLAGGKRVADTVGAGSHDFGTDGRKPNGDWEKGANGLRPGGQKSLAELWGKSKPAVTFKVPSPEGETALPHVLKVAIPEDTDEAATADQGNFTPAAHAALLGQGCFADAHAQAQPAPQHLTRPPEKHIFQGLCFYINGSTMPLISDHKLKYLLTQHGASHSITLGRRTVTHVVLDANCGGGLAGSKLHKEITKSRGNTVRYITVEW